MSSGAMTKAEIQQTLADRQGLVCGICGGSLKKEWAELQKWRKGWRIKRTRINIDIDHITPKSTLKGKHWWKDLGNLRLTHRTCNQNKSDKVDHE